MHEALHFLDLHLTNYCQSVQLLWLKSFSISLDSIESSQSCIHPTCIFSKVWLVGIQQCDKLFMEQAAHSFGLRPHTLQTLNTFTAPDNYLFFLCHGVQLNTPHAGAAGTLPATVHSRVTWNELTSSGQGRHGSGVILSILFLFYLLIRFALKRNWRTKRGGPPVKYCMCEFVCKSFA